MKISKSIKKIISFTITIALFLCALTGLVNIKLPAYAEGETGISSVSVPNKNFDSSSGGASQPYSPSGFVPTVDEKNANVTAGVINLDNNETYSGKYKRNPLASEDYVLMISSTDEDGATHYANYGYKSENLITLDADSHYKITVDVLTSNNDGIGTFYLFDGEDHVFAKIDNISAENWTTYTFLISTNELESSSVKIGMYLQGMGTVLFDNISCDKLNSATMQKMLSTYKVDYKFIDKRENTLTTTTADALALKCVDVDYSNNVSSKTLVGKSADSNAFDGNNTKAIKIENSASSYVKYATEDNFFTFKQNYIYKVGVTAKGVGLSSTANLQLVQTNLKEDETENNSSSLSITSSTATGLNNGYTQYLFYVRTGVTGSTNYKLEISLGSSSSPVSGAVYLTEISVGKVDYQTYSSASTSSSRAKLDLLSGQVITDNDIMLNNGNFNGIEIASGKDTFPANPSNWSVSTGNNKQYYGVVNTTQFDELNSLDLDNVVNPGDPGLSKIPGNNNILMMYNSTADKLAYTSESKSLTAKSYYKFSVDVNTQNLGYLTLSLITNINGNEFNLISRDVNTHGAWQTVEFYVYAGYQDLDVSLKAELISTSYAYAYLDNAMFNFEFAEATRGDIFNNLVETEIKFKLDLSKFVNADNKLFSNPEVDNVTTGYVNVSNSDAIKNLVEPDNMNSFKKLEGDTDIIYIRALDDSVYSLTSNLGFGLKANSYYEIKVSLFTQNLQSIEGKKVYGATIRLSGFDDAFNNVYSDNEWTTYTFLLNPSADVTSYLTLGIGSDGYPTTGDAFFGKIEFNDSLTKDDFDNAMLSAVTKKFSQTQTTNDDETADTTTPSENNQGVDTTTLLYQISTLIFVAAIIIAVVGVLLRKVKWKKFSKKTKNDYDRQTTVSKQYYDRIATAKIEKDYRELNKELENLTNERTSYEENYKADISKLRQLKIKRADAAEIAKLERDMKKNQRVSAQIGVRIKSVQSEMEFIKTDGYKNDLMKKMQQEAKLQPAESATPAKETTTTAKTTPKQKSKPKTKK